MRKIDEVLRIMQNVENLGRKDSKEGEIRYKVNYKMKEILMDDI